MDEHRTKEVLDFLLTSYRAKLAIQNSSENCPFDFQQFLTTWRGKCHDWGALRAAMKRDLEPLMQEGIFDSIIPYLSASINQSEAKREDKLQDAFEGNSIISTDLFTLTPRSKSRDRDSHKGTENVIDDKSEIVIHVCDEAKNVKQDFKCVQSLLVQEMGYFSKVTVKGQKLKDMDISVHCDIAVFDWLMKWIKAKTDEKVGVSTPKLEPSNVIGLMVSAEFLQMPTLTTECIQFTADNIEDVILTSPNLGCLNETLTNRLSTYFDNVEIETKIGRIDKNDRITSRLYTQFIMSLNESPGERGNFSSTNTLFKCITCGKLLINDIASKVPCVSMRMDCRGRLYSNHVKDNNWSLVNYIKDLKRELKSWRRVYWRLWSTVHFLCCTSCQIYFPVKDLAQCRYHPKLPQLQVSILSATGEIQERIFDTADAERTSNGGKQHEKEECINPFRRSRLEKVKHDKDDDEIMYETINCAFGVHPCCRKAGYKFYPLPPTNGCQFRDHVLSKHDENGPVVKRIQQFRDLIVVSAKSVSDVRKGFEWGGIVDLTPPKLSTSSSSTFSPWSGQGMTKSMFPKTLAFLTPSKSSSTDSNSASLSDTEDTTSPAYVNPLKSGQQQLNEFWNWNSDFTTRYNQDMQREKEEKLMSDLELLLSQRVSLESSGASSMRFGYLSRRTPKNLGGSFIKLEERWREEQKSGSRALGQSQQQRQTAKSAKP